VTGQACASSRPNSLTAARSGLAVSVGSTFASQLANPKSGSLRRGWAVLATAAILRPATGSLTTVTTGAADHRHVVSPVSFDIEGEA
jgi:hypothetical protein